MPVRKPWRKLLISGAGGSYRMDTHGDVQSVAQRNLTASER